MSTPVAPRETTRGEVVPPPPAHRGRRRRTTARIISTIIASALSVAGGLLVTVAAVAPEQVERAYGSVQTTARQLRTEILGEAPIVRLGGDGGAAELDRCDGTFTHMIDYTRKALPPVWAAHNSCGGDTILPLQIGDQLQVEHDGASGLYTIVETRTVPKTWSSTDELVGLRGELALQTCFYGVNDMTFLGLEPVAQPTAVVNR